MLMPVPPLIAPPTVQQTTAFADGTRVKDAEVQHRDAVRPGDADTHARAAGGLASGGETHHRVDRRSGVDPEAPPSPGSPSIAALRVCSFRTTGEHRCQAGWCAAAMARQRSMSSADRMQQSGPAQPL